MCILTKHKRNRSETTKVMTSDRSKRCIPQKQELPRLINCFWWFAYFVKINSILVDIMSVWIPSIHSELVNVIFAICRKYWTSMRCITNWINAQIFKRTSNPCTWLRHYK